jgi:hypothetical protein
MEDKGFEEKMAGEIPVEEEAHNGTDKKQGERWTEEFVVAGEELLTTVKRLVREANVRRIVIKNKEKRILIEIPLVLGVAGIAFLPVYASLALAGALMADCTIAVERVGGSGEQAS